jgi:hypothetical protein
MFAARSVVPSMQRKTAHIGFTKNDKEIRNFLFPSRDNFADEKYAAEGIYIEHLIICIFFSFDMTAKP